MCCEVVSRCECQAVCRVFSLITVINCCYFRSMTLTVCTVLDEELLKLVDVRCYVGEWLINVEDMALFGVLGLGSF